MGDKRSLHLRARKIASSSTGLTEAFRVFRYDDNELFCGEVVRNLCVNLGIDPDTRNGITWNVEISLNGNKWSYTSNSTLISCGVKDGDSFEFREITSNEVK
jgi:hypothetical protein